MLEIVPNSCRAGARSGVVKRCRTFLRSASHTLTVCEASCFLSVCCERGLVCQTGRLTPTRLTRPRGSHVGARRSILTVCISVVFGGKGQRWSLVRLQKKLKHPFSPISFPPLHPVFIYAFCSLFVHEERTVPSSIAVQSSLPSSHAARRGLENTIPSLSSPSKLNKKYVH